MTKNLGNAEASRYLFRRGVPSKPPAQWLRPTGAWRAREDSHAKGLRFPWEFVKRLLRL